MAASLVLAPGGSGRVLVYVRLMDSSPGEGVSGLWALCPLTCPAGPARTNAAPTTAVPGIGAASVCVFPDGIQETVIA
jgi:hypothetical protein